MEARRMWPVVSNSQSDLERRRSYGMRFMVNKPIPRRGRAMIDQRNTAKYRTHVSGRDIPTLGALKVLPSFVVSYTR